MNAVWNSYGQLCGCPEIFKKSCKFFCRELDIRVAQVVKSNVPQVMFLQELPELRTQTLWMERKSVACCHYRTGRPAWLTLTQKLFYLRMERKGTAARLGF